MSDPVKLVTREGRIVESVVQEAERLLAAAKNGEFDAFVTVVRTSDGGWKEYRSGAMNFPEMVGLIELAKLSWSADYLRDAVKEI